MKTWEGVVAVALVVLLAGCGILNDDRTAVFSSELASVQAFQSSVYALTRAKCIDCHGAGIGPQFASANLQTAYTLSRGYVDFSNIANSRIVARTKDGHCGGSCRGDGAEMIAAISTWWANGESGLESTEAAEQPVSVTQSLGIPALPSSTTVYTFMQWPLSSFLPTLSGAIFEVDIQQFNGSTYRVRNPRITSGGYTIKIKDIRILINGKYDPANNAYVTIETTIAANTTLVLSSIPMLMLQDKGAAQDQLSVQFGKLTAAP